MSDEISIDEWADREYEENAGNSETEETPAVIDSERLPALPDVSEDPHNGTTPWTELTDSQKLDILHMKVDAIGAQTTWLGQTIQGIVNMVGNVKPADILKMMRGGK